jgi:hypothetical protein
LPDVKYVSPNQTISSLKHAPILRQKRAEVICAKIRKIDREVVKIIERVKKCLNCA